jgi:hypothetical protein
VAEFSSPAMSQMLREKGKSRDGACFFVKLDGEGVGGGGSSLDFSQSVRGMQKNLMIAAEQLRVVVVLAGTKSNASRLLAADSAESGPALKSFLKSHIHLQNFEPDQLCADCERAC